MSEEMYLTMGNRVIWTMPHHTMTGNMTGEGGDPEEEMHR